MRRTILAFALWAIISPAFAQIGGLAFPGPGGAAAGGGGGGFVGAGDIVSGAKTYYSATFAYSAATRGAKIINVCNSTGGTDVGCADMVTDATTGIVAPQTIAGIPCPGANCTIKIFYDQTVSGACAGSCDQISGSGSGSIGGRANFAASVVGSLPAAQFSNGSTYTTAANGTAIAAPNTFAFLGRRTGSFTTQQNIWLDGGVNSALQWASSTNTLQLYMNGPTISATMSDSTVHSAIGVDTASGSASLAIDGTATTGTTGAATATPGNGGVGVFGSRGTLSEDLLELSMYGGTGFTGTQITNFSANQHTRCGC